MVTHSIILAWKIPWTKKCGGLQTMGSQRIGHNWTTEHTRLICMPRSGIAGSNGNSIFNFLRTSILFSIAAVSIYSLRDSISPHPFPHVIVYFFDNSHFKRCKVISHCDFEFSFPWGLMLGIFLCACWPSICFLWVNPYSNSLSFFFSF